MEAIDAGWDAVRKLVEELRNRDPNSFTQAQLQRISTIIRILHVCDPTSRRGIVHLTSIGGMLRSMQSSNAKWPIRKNAAPSIAGPIKQVIQLINLLQARRIPSLAQLSCYAIRNALCSFIGTKVEVLLTGLPPPQQNILRSQILLYHVLSANALHGVAEAFASVDAFKSSLNMPIRGQSHEWEDWLYSGSDSDESI